MEYPNLRGIALYPAAVELYLADRPELTQKSVSKARLVARTLQERHPDTRVNQFSFEDLRDYVLRDSSGRTRADLTQRSYRSQLLVLFEWLQAEDHITLNPAAKLKVKVRPGNHQVRHAAHHWLDTATRQALLDACEVDEFALRSLRDRVLLKTGLFTGLRCQELAALSWGPHPDGVPLNVVDLVGKRVIITVAKNSKPATIGLPGALVDALEEYRSVLSKAAGRPLGAGDPLFQRAHKVATGGIFPGRSPKPEDITYRLDFRPHVWRRTDRGWQIAVRGGGLSHEGIRNIVRKRGDVIGLYRLGPHDLRRTFAKTLEDQDYPLEAISKALRHEDVGTTKRYLEQNPEKVAAIGHTIQVDVA